MKYMENGHKYIETHTNTWRAHKIHGKHIQNTWGTHTNTLNPVRFHAFYYLLLRIDEQ